MPSVLLTAFEPYGEWSENASWLALIQLTQNLPDEPKVTTRRYPVCYEGLQERLESDLAANYDVVLHLGQAPGSTEVALETIGLNIAGDTTRLPEEFPPLIADGPVAYQTNLPVHEWAERLRQTGVPAQVSHHAGTYLCNAVLYLSQHIVSREGFRSQVGFIHLPLDVSQTITRRRGMPAMPSQSVCQGLRAILEEINLAASLA